MILEPSLFFRKYGIRNSNQLVKPPLPKLELLNLPKNSIFHYPGTSALDDGPVDTDPIFGQTQRPIYIDHISRISSTEGNPRVLVYDVNKQIRLHRTNNPRFRLFKDAETSYRDPFIHVCFSYSLIHRTYKYLRNYYTAYYQWYNLTSTIWNKIDEVTTYVPTINRNHYIEVDLPNILPSISSLNLAEKVMNQNTVKVFNSPESLMILDIWKWLGKNRSKSIIGLNLRSKEQYDKINIIFKESGRWFVINLGVLDSWRKSQPGEKPDGQEITKGLDPEQLQKRFLRLLISLFEARTNPDLPDNVDVKEDVVLDQSLDQTETKTTTVDNDGSLDPDDDDVDETTDVRNEREVIQIASDFEDENHEQIDAEIEADLEKLETTGDNSGMDVVVDGNVSTQVIEIKTKPNTLEGAIVEHCDRLADSGGLSAAEYRKYLEMASTYKTLKAPDGTTLDKFIQIAPQDLQIKESPSIPDKNTIVDKTMLKSSLLEFDKKYVNHILQKDIAAAVLSIQKAGVIVTDYEVEEVEDITGSHFVYQVKIKPLQGTASTIHFKIPKVDDEGNFMVNGVNYRLRKQRGDLPIRKISPSRVSLTSYYGKVFVERNDRRTNNYGKWLAASIMVLGFNKESDLITNMAPGNSFRNEIKLPRLYTILAQNFNSFTLKTKRNEYDLYWNLNFDYNSRAKITSSNNIGEIEQDGAVVAGSNSQGQILVIGKNNALYHTVSSTDFSLQAMPSIEDLLGISSKKTPLDFAELRVFGKSIPVGVILSYLYGFSKLVRSLKITPRVVPAGQRAQLTPDEWEIVFQDETWVFNREDRLASMILGGWREHRDTTITYNVHEFDKPDVYLNVLEDAGLGVRYLREIDLLSNMFVDPITKDLLVEMKEPTDFEGLLKRSSELLLLDHHPNELDSEYMRIKGYERFAGVVYSEMVRSIRIHNARPGKYRYPVEMNPYAVWIQINQDPAKNQVVEINPIQNMKEAEAVTYSGIGGRSSRSMVKRTRVYHKNDMGTISESTVDNSDVGINIFLSGDPQFTSLRGISRRYVVGKSGATPLLSSSALLSVGATVDD